MLSFYWHDIFSIVNYSLGWGIICYFGSNKYFIDPMDDIAIKYYVNHHSETMEKQKQQQTQPLVPKQK